MQVKVNTACQEVLWPKRNEFTCSDAASNIPEYMSLFPSGNIALAKNGSSIRVERICLGSSHVASG